MNGGDGEADNQRFAEAGNGKSEHVAPRLSRAKPVFSRRALEEVSTVNLAVFPGADVGADDCKDHDQYETDEAEHRGLRTGETTPNQLTAGQRLLVEVLVLKRLVRDLLILDGNFGPNTFQALLASARRG